MTTPYCFTPSVISTYLTEKALLLVSEVSSLIIRKDFFCFFFSPSKSKVTAFCNDWWQIASLSDMDFKLRTTNVPPNLECLPGGGFAVTFCLSFFLAAINSSSSFCFSVLLRCMEASANDSGVCSLKSRERISNAWRWYWFSSLELAI